MFLLASSGLSNHDLMIGPFKLSFGFFHSCRLLDGGLILKLEMGTGRITWVFLMHGRSNAGSFLNIITQFKR